MSMETSLELCEEEDAAALDCLEEITEEERRDLEKQKAARRTLKTGEWACVDAKCSHINQEFRNTCDKCGKPKPRAKNRIGREIGKDAAEKSKGLFAAEDWSCTKCGNINWARRPTCNICNAPKLGDLEVRTGYGGGYMDREDVEYIERKDEDEFDEFGRKKKRRTENSSVCNENISRNFEHSEREKTDYKTEKSVNNSDRQATGKKMDDSEEDEDDDVDLDKYDLTADLELPESMSKREEISNGKWLAKENTPQRPDSRCSSCSCSCSGGECSCEDSDDSAVDRKKWDRGSRSNRKSRSRSPVRHSDRHRR